jgi:hypothetical protein
MEIARDRAHRRTNPWRVFVSSYFTECKEAGVKPWGDVHPMTHASQVYQEMQEMHAAFRDSGKWDEQAFEGCTESKAIDPDSVYCEVDWDDHISYQEAA